MSCGLKLRMKTTVPSTIGGMLVAIDWPNMWLSGSRLRKRSGRNGLRIFLVLGDLALDRHDVRQHVAVTDDHAFGFGGRARREDDLRDVVCVDLHRRHRRRRGPVDVAEPPDWNSRGTGRVAGIDGDVIADHDARLASTMPATLHQKLDRRAVVDRDDDRRPR